MDGYYFLLPSMIMVNHMPYPVKVNTTQIHS